MNTTARTYLKELYLSWVNDYLTIEVFAEHHGLTGPQAEDLIYTAKKVFESNHPDS